MKEWVTFDGTNFPPAKAYGVVLITHNVTGKSTVTCIKPYTFLRSMVKPLPHTRGIHGLLRVRKHTEQYGYDYTAKYILTENPARAENLKRYVNRQLVSDGLAISNVKEYADTFHVVGLIHNRTGVIVPYPARMEKDGKVWGRRSAFQLMYVKRRWRLLRQLHSDPRVIAYLDYLEQQDDQDNPVADYTVTTTGVVYSSLNAARLGAIEYQLRLRAENKPYICFYTKAVISDASYTVTTEDIKGLTELYGVTATPELAALLQDVMRTVKET